VIDPRRKIAQAAKRRQLDRDRKVVAHITRVLAAADQARRDRSTELHRRRVS